MGRTACTEPQGLYKGDLYLSPYQVSWRASGFRLHFYRFFGYTTRESQMETLKTQILLFRNLLNTKGTQ